MADTVVARPSAAVPEPAVPEVSAAEAETQAKATAAAKAKHSHSQSQSQPRKVRFNVGSNYKVLEIIGEGVSTLFCSWRKNVSGVDDSTSRSLTTGVTIFTIGIWGGCLCIASAFGTQGRHQEDRTVRSHHVSCQRSPICVPDSAINITAMHY